MQAKFNVKTVGGVLVTSFTTDSSGKFTVFLDPGSYIIQYAGTASFPRYTGPTSFNVTAGQLTKLNLTFDSGIR